MVASFKLAGHGAPATRRSPPRPAAPKPARPPKEARHEKEARAANGHDRSNGAARDGANGALRLRPEDVIPLSEDPDFRDF